MNKDHLYDISEVCNLIGTTSRTLRYYEEKGIIQSTTPVNSSRRKYTEEQLANIRNVLVLRTLGLSVKSIAELQNQRTYLKNAVLSKRAEIYASIDTRIREINLLNEALFALESGEDIFAQNQNNSTKDKSEGTDIAHLCTDAILSDDTDTLYEYLSPRLLTYMPKEVYTVIRKDTLSPLGDLVSIEKVTVDDKYPNKIYSYVKFSKLGLKITFVFYCGRIEGLWLGYYDINALKIKGE